MDPNDPSPSDLTDSSEPGQAPTSPGQVRDLVDALERHVEATSDAAGTAGDDVVDAVPGSGEPPD